MSPLKRFRFHNLQRPQLETGVVGYFEIVSLGKNHGINFFA
jgi:hypothetical protein